MRHVILAIAVVVTWPLEARSDSTSTPPTAAPSDPLLASVPAPRRVVSSWEEALSLVRSNSTDLRIAYDQIKEAEAQTRVAVAQALTSVTAQGSITHNMITAQSSQVVSVDANGNPVFEAFTAPTPTYLQGSVQMVQPILAVQTWHAIGTARASEEASRLSAEDLKRTLSMHLANTLVGVFTAERIAELNRTGLRSALDRLDLAVTRERLGGATGVDVARARQDVDAARATLVNGDEMLRQAREALGLALGIPEQVGVSPDARLEGLEAGARGACPELDSLELRPDLAAARKRIEVAQRNVTDVNEQFLPTIAAESVLSTTTLDTGALPRTLWNIQGVLTIPIWDGGARYGMLRNARALEDAAQQQYTGARRSALVQVEQARRAIEIASQSLAIATDAREQAANVDRITQAAYREGQGTSLDLVTAAAALRQSEINLALAEYGAVKARILAVLSLATCRW
jgi:outer membrane protein TolC